MTTEGRQRHGFTVVRAASIMACASVRVRASGVVTLQRNSRTNRRHVRATTHELIGPTHRPGARRETVPAAVDPSQGLRVCELQRDRGRTKVDTLASWYDRQTDSIALSAWRR